MLTLSVVVIHQNLTSHTALSELISKQEKFQGNHILVGTQLSNLQHHLRICKHLDPLQIYCIKISQKKTLSKSKRSPMHTVLFIDIGKRSDRNLVLLEEKASIPRWMRQLLFLKFLENLLTPLKNLTIQIQDQEAEWQSYTLLCSLSPPLILLSQLYSPRDSSEILPKKLFRIQVIIVN